jgi:hypothetical protein
MNESNSTPPPIPSPQPPQSPPTLSRPSYGAVGLGEDPHDRAAIPNFLAAIEAILRQPRRVMYQLRQPGAGKLIAAMLAVTFICSLIYGVVVGTFSGGAQLWAAPVKVAGGLLLSALICLPSLYIFTCLSGSEARPAEVFGLVTGLLMLMTILLIGFAPVAWLFSQSTKSAAWMGVLHLSFWAIATGFGLRFLEAGFSHSRMRSNSGLGMWAVIFVLVVLQMTTALRPIVGAGDSFFPKEKKFFVAHWEDSLKAAESSPASSR